MNIRNRIFCAPLMLIYAVTFSFIFLSKPGYSMVSKQEATDIKKKIETLPSKYKFKEPLNRISSQLVNSASGKSNFEKSQTIFLGSLMAATLKVALLEKPLESKMFGFFVAATSVSIILTKVLVLVKRGDSPDAEEKQLASDGAKWHFRRWLHRLIYETSLNLTGPNQDKSFGIKIMEGLNLSGINVDQVRDANRLIELDTFNRELRNDLYQQVLFEFAPQQRGSKKEVLRSNKVAFGRYLLDHFSNGFPLREDFKDAIELCQSEIMDLTEGPGWYLSDRTRSAFFSALHSDDQQQQNEEMDFWLSSASMAYYEAFYK